MTDVPKLSVAELRIIAQPPEVLARNGEHWTGKYMRRVSIYVTGPVLRLGVSANTVTVVMIGVGLTGVALLTRPSVAGAVGAAIAIQLYLCLDCVDGEVARTNGTSSAVGVYLDRLGHYLVEGGLMIALGIRVAQGDLGWVVLGMVACIGVMMEKVESDLVSVARLAKDLGQPPPDASLVNRPSLRSLRRVAMAIPLHLATHAAEASLLVLIAAIIDETRGRLDASRSLLVCLTAITTSMVVLHLVSIMSSNRLTTGAPDQHEPVILDT